MYSFGLRAREVICILCAKAFDYVWDRKAWIGICLLLGYFLGFSRAQNRKIVSDNEAVVTQLNKNIEIYKFQMFKYRREASLTDIKLTACQSKKTMAGRSH